MKKCPPGPLKTWEPDIFSLPPGGRFSCLSPGAGRFSPAGFRLRLYLPAVSRPSSFFGCLWLYFARSRLSFAADFRLMPAEGRPPVGFDCCRLKKKFACLPYSPAADFRLVPAEVRPPPVFAGARRFDRTACVTALRIAANAAGTNKPPFCITVKSRCGVPSDNLRAWRFCLLCC